MAVRTPPDRDGRRRGIAIATLAMVALSTDSLFARAADAARFDVVFWVGAFTAAAMAIAGTALHRAGPVALIRRGGMPLLAAAALQALTLTSFVVAVRTTTVANVVAIIAAAPLAAAVVARLLLGERATARVWSAAGLSGVGVLVIVSGSVGEGGDLRGDLLAVVAILGFAVGVTVLRRHPQLERTSVVGLAGALMATVALPAATVQHDAGTWLALLAIGGIVGPLARVLLAVAPRYLTAGEVGLFAPLETVLASVWAYLAFDEVPAGTTWVGGSIVLASLVWANWPRRNPSAVGPPARYTLRRPVRGRAVESGSVGPSPDPDPSASPRPEPATTDPSPQEPT